MAYLATSDFKYGMDRRRPRAVGVPGTLWILKNAVITRGGDIERTKKFVATHALPSNTFGLAAFLDELYVFGSVDEPADLPDDILYQKLLSGTAGVMERVFDVKTFDGKLYVVAGFSDGGVYHFFNGTVVSEWLTLGETTSSFTTVATRLARLLNENPAVDARAIGNKIRIRAKVPGIDFTISTVADGGGDTPESLPTAVVSVLQPNVPAAAEVKAAGSITVNAGSVGPMNRITAVMVDGVPLISSPVPWQTSNASTANALAVAIMNGSSMHGYGATVAGNVVTITAPTGLGASANGRAVAASVSGTVAVSSANLAGGISAASASRKLVSVTISGASYDHLDLWGITINGAAYKTKGWASRVAMSVFNHKQRIWAPIGGLIRYCKLNDPMNWTDPSASSGAGFINVAAQTETTAEMTTIAEYSGKMAIFSRDAIVIYNIFADAQNNAYDQTIGNTGTLAPGSVVSYGANDVYYLDNSGIRSLRTRDGFDAAYTSDIGSAVDPYIQQLLAASGELEYGRIKSIIESVDGRLMMSFGSQMLALSYFPASKITAWSLVDLEAPIDELVRSGRDIYVRSGDTIYTYGGLDRATYPSHGENPVVVETPFLSAQDPAGKKQLRSYDHAATNEWRVEILVDPNDESKTVEVGRLVGTTYNKGAAWVPGEAAVFAVRYTCDSAGFATLSATANHYETGEKQ